MIDQLAAKGIERIRCNARANKTDFYKRFAMTKTDLTYVKGGINFVVMENKGLLTE